MLILNLGLARRVEFDPARFDPCLAIPCPGMAHFLGVLRVIYIRVSERLRHPAPGHGIPQSKFSLDLFYAEFTTVLFIAITVALLES